MSDYDARPFCCGRCGWVLGESYREAGSRITRLRVYRFARPPNSGLDTRDVPAWHKFSVTQVNDGKILCTCGHGEGWYANQTAIGDMLARRNNRKLERVK